MGHNQVKINQQIYRVKVLIPGLIPWARKSFGSERWTFQQNSAPSHRQIGTQNWLKANVPVLIDRDMWPSSSPDLNPLDFCIWGLLQATKQATKHTSVKALKASLTREWNCLSDDVVRAACASFRKRLKLVV
ncbi:unnamed protein product [Parnassius apollo]|uniref:(apollo) hypothetical protein n=1 Tax=Parnassius apollo TaxID=110799 RepID=A0A8S3WVI9_PARAO|nr:unnamed protein product [Parnassius apollo]